MNNNLILEKRSEPDKTPTYQTEGGSVLMMTPAIDAEYWAYRVKLHQDQAIIGFPKFGTIGIGFTQEEDWNTNLPYTCEAEEIYNHIKHNKKYDEITKEQVIEAIGMIREQAKKDMGREFN